MGVVGVSVTWFRLSRDRCCLLVVVSCWDKHRTRWERWSLDQVSCVRQEIVVKQKGGCQSVVSETEKLLTRVWTGEERRGGCVVQLAAGGGSVCVSLSYGILQNHTRARCGVATQAVFG